MHQRGLGSIYGRDVINGLSLLILCCAPRGFSAGTPDFPSQQTPTFDIRLDLLSVQLVEHLCSHRTFEH